MRFARQFAIRGLAGLFLVLAGAAQLSAQSVFADFDGDHKLDTARVVSTGAHKSIRINLSGLGPSYLSFDSDNLDDGRLLVGDVNHDDNPDLLWVSQTAPQSAMVWLGDGRGHFAVVDDVSAYRSELNGLLGVATNCSISEVANKRSACGLAPSHPMALALARGPVIVAPHPSLTVSRERRDYLAAWLAHLYERGPPANSFL